MPSSALPASPNQSESRPVYWLLCLVAAAIAARAWLLFSTPLVPGMNGAYYLVQARSLLEHGRLGVPDLPLTFWLHASLARLLQLVSGMPQDAAIVWAVKLADATLPPLAALPVAWLGKQWWRSGERPSAFVWLAPAAAVCLSSLVLRMTGDFQKNALALVWLAALAPAALVFLRRPSLRTMALPLVLLALLGLTHIGVLGGALVFCAALAVVALVSAKRGTRRHILLLILLGAGVLGIAVGSAYTLYDPARVTRLVEAFVQPATALEDRGPGHPPGPPPGEPQPFNAAAPDRQPAPPDSGETSLRGSEQGMPPRPPDSMGGPGFGLPPGWGAGHGPGHGWADPRTLFPAGSCFAIALCALWLLWRQRRELTPAERSVATAAALTALVLAAPIYDGQKAERLLLVAIIPTAIAATFVLSRIVLLSWSRIVGACALTFVLTDAARALPFGGRASVGENLVEELRSLAPFCPAPERTLIVARHGLEWWAAWTLHTHIAQPTAVTAADWSAYAHVLYLKEKERFGPPNGGEVGRSGPQSGDAPRDRPGQPRSYRDGPPHGPGEIRLPPNAQSLHDGPTLTLACVPTAPEHVGRIAPPEPGLSPDSPD